MSVNYRNILGEDIREKKMKRKLLIATGILLAYHAGFMAWIFYGILTKGYRVLAEPSIGIAVAEFTFAILLCLFGIFCMIIGLRKG